MEGLSSLFAICNFKPSFEYDKPWDLTSEKYWDFREKSSLKDDAKAVTAGHVAESGLHEVARAVAAIMAALKPVVIFMVGDLQTKRCYVNRAGMDYKYSTPIPAVLTFVEDQSNHAVLFLTISCRLFTRMRASRMKGAVLHGENLVHT